MGCFVAKTYAKVVASKLLRIVDVFRIRTVEFACRHFVGSIASLNATLAHLAEVTNVLFRHCSIMRVKTIEV